MSLCTWSHPSQCPNVPTWECDFVKAEPMNSPKDLPVYVTEFTLYCDEHMNKFRGQIDVVNIRRHKHATKDDFFRELN